MQVAPGSNEFFLALMFAHVSANYIAGWGINKPTLDINVTL